MGVGALVMVVSLICVQVLAPGPSERATMIQVRAADGTAARLLALGTEHSPTFRSLVDRIEDSDLVVYVLTDRFLPQAGKMQIVHATPRWRYVRVTVRAPGLDPERDVVAWLAHELQHVAELADAPQVRDDGTLTFHYHNVGWVVGRFGPLAFETEEADDIKWLVLDEMYGG